MYKSQLIVTQTELIVLREVPDVKGKSFNANNCTLSSFKYDFYLCKYIEFKKMLEKNLKYC